VSLSAEEMPKAASTRSTGAYSAYLQARLYVLRGTKADSIEAVESIQRALQLDADFAAAWARLANIRSFQFELGAIPFEQANVETHRAAQRAVALDPNLSAAHVSMARAYFMFDWNWVGADAEIRRAREIDPNDADALRWAGVISAVMGRNAEAIELLRQAIERDPLMAANYALLGGAYAALGQFNEARDAYSIALTLAPPNGFGARASLGTLLLANGQPAAALAEFNQATVVEDREVGQALVYFAQGRAADSDTILADLKEHYSNTNALGIADNYAYRGERDQAFEWLKRAYRQHENGLHFISRDPMLAALRSDQRYTEFLAKMKLPE